MFIENNNLNEIEKGSHDAVISCSTRVTTISVQGVHQVHRVDHIQVVRALSRVASQRALQTSRGSDRHRGQMFAGRAVRSHSGAVRARGRVSQKSNIHSYAAEDDRSNESRGVPETIVVDARSSTHRLGLAAFACSQGCGLLSRLHLHDNRRTFENSFD